MSQTVKSFVTVGSLIDNNVESNSMLGELTTLSRTYSKDIWEYQQDLYPGYKCIVFKSVNNTTALPEQLSITLVAEIFSIVKYCVVKSLDLIQPYNIPSYTNDVSVNFDSISNNMLFGDFVSNGPISLPEWISWNTITGDTIKVWLSDVSFQDLYDDFEIVIVPPVSDLEMFFNSYAATVTAINNRSESELIVAIQTAINSYPPTVIRSNNIGYVNPVNPTQITPVNWSSLIYGKAGDNLDSIKDKIIDYLLTNSERTVAEWKTVFPELFERTEFYIYPRWDKYSILNNTPGSSLYRSILKPTDNISFITSNVNFLPIEHLKANLTAFPYDYKALMLLAFGNETNVVGKRNLEDIFTDYIPVNTLSVDFNRMSLYTKSWMTVLEKGLIIAETANQFTTLPNPYRRVIKNNVLYISVVYENVSYLIAAKSNLFYQV